MTRFRSVPPIITVCASLLVSCSAPPTADVAEPADTLETDGAPDVDSPSASREDVTADSTGGLQPDTDTDTDTGTDSDSRGEVRDEPVPETPAVAPDFGPGFELVSLPVGGEASPVHLFSGDEREKPDVTSGFFGDVDGDGSGDYVISATPSSELESAPSTAVFSYDARAATLSVATGLPARGRVLAVLDVDSDGQTDVLMATGETDVLWGTDSGLSTPTRLGELPYLSHDPKTPIGAFDVDEDGWLDLLIRGGSCCESTCPEVVPVLREGLRQWRRAPELVDGRFHLSPYAVLGARLGDGEAFLMSFGARERNCGTVPRNFFRSVAPNDMGYPFFEPVEVVPPGAQAEFTLAAPMGAAVGDVNNDGLFDIAIPQDAAGDVLYVAGEVLPMTDGTDRAGFRLTPSTNGRAQLGWGTAMLDLDQDGRPDLVIAHGNDHGSFLFADDDRGEMWTTAHWNNGDGRFVDVSEQLGISERGHWTALTVTDLEEDGDADLIVGGQGQLPRLYRNRIVTTNHGFSMRLRGTTSNHLGIGAVVRVKTEAAEEPFLFQAGTTASQAALSEPLVFVGLGPHLSATWVEVEWPSGLVQRLDDVEAGRLHTVVEPEVIAIEPAGRHLSAGGPDAAMITVTPRGSDGSGIDAEVTVANVFGRPVDVSLESHDGDTWVFAARAPDEPGSTVFEVTIDGEPVRVRPRLWWD